MGHIGAYLKDIYFNKKSGRLIFRRQNIRTYLFFQNGLLIFAKTNQRLELFGEVLFKLGRISEEVYSRIEEHIEPGHKLGESLIKKGLIKESDIHDALSYQMKEIAFDIFPIFDGEFNFHEITGFFEHVIEIKIDVPVLIEEGIRRMNFDPSLIEFSEKTIPYPKNREFFDRLNAEEKNVLGRIDGTSSALKLQQTSGLNLELFWKSLYLLYCLDLVGFRGEEETFEKEAEAKKMAAEEMEKRIREAVDLSEHIATMSHYQILNVTSTASQSEIKKSYFKSARKYHPDFFGGEVLPDVKDKIEEVFSCITKAYYTLIDEEKRKDYDSKMEVFPPEEKRDWTKRAEMKFRQGKTLYNEEKYEDALILLGEAVRMMRDKGSYFLLLALTESKIPSLHRKAEQDFIRAINLEPWNPEAYVGLGLLYKKEGLVFKASRRFKKALSLDPQHEGALRELGLSGKAQKKKGLKEILSFELFGKKKR